MNRSILIAILFSLALVGWMLSGMLNGEQEETAEPPKRPNQLKVKVRHSEASFIQRQVSVPGRTAPARRVTLKAETEGTVVSTPAERGQSMSSGNLLVELGLDNRKLQRQRAEALLEQRRLEYEAAQRLRNRDLQSEAEVAAASALYEEAKEMLESVELDILDTQIRAPFNGILSDRMVEVGDFVAVGDPVAAFIEIDPLKVLGYLTEKEIVQVRLGDIGTAVLNTGEVLEGRIRYIAPDADESSRTFLVELWVDNPDRIPAGVTANLELPTDQIKAHRISPAYVTLNEAGAFGVKLVDEQGTVRFAEIKLVKSDTDGLFVSGLPDQARIITLGQGFAVPGEKVATELEDSTADNTSNVESLTPISATW